MVIYVCPPVVKTKSSAYRLIGLQTVLKKAMQLYTQLGFTVFHKMIFSGMCIWPTWSPDLELKYEPDV